MAKSEPKRECKPEEWTTAGFISRFMEVHENPQEQAFAFVLGSGASVSSGIPAAGKLARRWVEELYERAVEGDDRPSLEEWAMPENLEIEEFNLDDAASFYADVYDRRFHDDDDLGYAYIERVMSKKDPGVGYSILAQMMERTQHRVVITTNFDNLVADALAIFTDTFPLVCGHESLTGFVRPQLRRPLIAKIHRDLLFAPRSSAAKTSVLPKKWKSALRRLFKHYIPVFIGYGGNDGSLMGFLESLKPADISGKRIYWCYWKEGGRPAERICRLVEKLNGVIVPILGFDELMLQLQDRLGHGFLDFDEVFEKRPKERARKYREKVEELQRKIDPEDKEVQEAFTSAVEREKSWWAWELRASAEKDPAKREVIYRLGLEQFPKSAELYGNFANFLCDVRKDYDEAEKLHKKALEIDPEHPTLLANFALFREVVRKDYDEAERLYKKAIEIEPARGGRLGNFATFLWEVRKDYGEAERLYRKAIEIDPEQADCLGSFANFLWHIRKDYDEAERLHRQSIEMNPEHADLLGNFGGFLVALHRTEEARGFLQRAWKANGGDVAQLPAEIAFYWCVARRAEGRDDTQGLGRLKFLLEKGFLRGSWSFDEVLAVVDKVVAEDEREFYHALADAILDEGKAGDLDQFERWKATKPIPIDEPWEM